MAKSARASRIKKNNQALKKKVFGPVEAARNERLHAKLLELAQAPRDEKMHEVVEQEHAQPDTDQAESGAPQDTDMHDTAASAKAPKSKREVARIRAARAARVEKNGRRKPRNLVTFATHPKKKKSNNNKQGGRR